MAAATSSTPSIIRRMRSQWLDSTFPTLPRRSRTDPDDSDAHNPSTIDQSTPFRAYSTPPERSNDKQPNRESLSEDLSGIEEVDQSWIRKTLSKTRSQFYDGAFAVREPAHTRKSMMERDALISVEVKLNCCMEFEQLFLVDFVFLLSAIYQRPAGCIMVTVNTTFTILRDTSADAAYQISITALKNEVTATKNKRAAGLVQRFMLENVHIPADRGVLQFTAILEENIICQDLSSKVEALEAESPPLDARRKSEALLQKNGRRSRKSSLAKPAVCPSKVTSTIRTKTPSFLKHEKLESTGTESSTTKAEQKKVKKRKSLMAVLGF